MDNTIYVYRDREGNTKYFYTFWQLFKFKLMGGSRNRMPRRERILQQDRYAEDEAEQRTELWQSAQRVEQARLNLEKEKAEAKKLTAERNELKYGKIKQSLRNLGKSLAEMEEPKVYDHLKHTSKPSKKKKYNSIEEELRDSMPF